MIAELGDTGISELAASIVAGMSSAQFNLDQWTNYSAGEVLSDRVLRAAEDPSTPLDILEMLAENCNVEVRMAVADNESAALSTLLMLAVDESADLRYQLAENHNIDHKVLKLLLADENPYVAHRAQRTIQRKMTGSLFVHRSKIEFAMNKVWNALITTDLLPARQLWH